MRKNSGFLKKPVFPHLKTTAQVQVHSGRHFSAIASALAKKKANFQF
jgi:hypothetical protein